MRSPLARDIVAGALAGSVGGALLAGAMLAQGAPGEVVGLVGARSAAAAFPLQVVVSGVAGAVFGGLFRFHPESHAAALSKGLVFGLLWWIAGPLTILPLAAGRSPTWSIAEASAAFPALVGDLMYGGVTGLLLHTLVAVYLRRSGPVELTPASAAVPRRVVVLGGGFGGVSVAEGLERRFAGDPSVEVTLISHSNFLLFTPMLSEVASSSLEAQHISAPVRAALRRTIVRRSEVVAVDLEGRRIAIRPSPTAPVEHLSYDHLVLALGVVPNFYGLPGLAEHSFTMKSLDDAMRLRNHVIGMLEQADSEVDAEERRRQLCFVVAGGGFAGVETIAELAELARSALRYYHHLAPAELRFVLVHSGDRILPELSPGLGAYALERLRERGIEFLLSARVAGATPTAVFLADGREVPTRTVVWTAGNQPHPLLRTLPCEKSHAGAVVTDATLRVVGYDNLWAVGDCAQIPDPTVPGQSYPPTAQHALREGEALAANLAAALTGKPLRPFRFRTIGTLASLGRGVAVAEIYGFKFSGFLAWVMWRTIYLSKLPGLEKKLRVALDWTIDLFFPRDIVHTRSAAREEEPSEFVPPPPARPAAESAEAPS